MESTQPEHVQYEEIKPISDADKTYSNEHENDSEVLRYASNEASFESEKIDNKTMLNLGRVFETSNQKKFLLGHL